ncbi:MAG: hypothetical protein KUG82_06460 [Pseudomonadales bacterium]|nr:hypothetical protein [Pseudomonadales bacterium]
MIKALHQQFQQATATTRFLWLALWLLLTTMLVVWIRSAWICDDAMITFRSVLNFVNGYGMRWNTLERVQSFTHPLWFFLLSANYFIWDEIFYSTIGLNLLLASAALWLLIHKLSVNVQVSITAVVILLFSKSFIDFSTSGLENALSYFLVALFCWLVLREHQPKVIHLFYAMMVCCLLMLNRIDFVLLIFPALTYYAFSHFRFRQIISTGVIAFSPLMAWIVFSLIYYGYPFPNTAYAKLNTGIESQFLLLQGSHYFLNSLSWDTVTLVGTVIGLTIGITSGDLKKGLLACGVILYLLYILSVGGDFMSGRFFSVPLFQSMILLVSGYTQASQRAGTIFKNRTSNHRLPSAVLFGIILLATVLGLRVDNPTLTTSLSYANGSIDRGIVDERGYSYFINGLFSENHKETFIVPDWHATHVTSVIQKGAVGKAGLDQGPNVHIVDFFALCDPLLSHLPSANQTRFRPGHYRRFIPDWYMESVLHTAAPIYDSTHHYATDLHQYYAIIQDITRGEIWNLERLKRIVYMNLGYYDYLLEGG